MSGRYGIKGCRHKWRFRKDGWEEGCVPAICIKCGAFGCAHDVGDKLYKPSFRNRFFKEGQDGNTNTNGQWVNPYVKNGGNGHGQGTENSRIQSSREDRVCKRTTERKTQRTLSVLEMQTLQTKRPQG